MTEKVKDRLTGWLITALFTLLGFIATGIGYLIMGTSDRLDEIEKMQKCDEKNIRNIANTVAIDPDTKEPYKSIMEDICFNPRGGEIKQ